MFYIIALSVRLAIEAVEQHFTIIKQRANKKSAWQRVSTIIIIIEVGYTRTVSTKQQSLMRGDDDDDATWR